MTNIAHGGKKWLTLVALAIIATPLLAACTPQTPSANNGQKQTQEAQLDTTQESEADTNQQPADITESDQQADESFLVIRVIDGDTVELEDGSRVRYIGIDTPETVDPSKPVQCFGKEASQKNTELVLNKQVRLEKDISDKDRYGRLLRYVYVGDTFVNLELVKQGFASSYSYPPDVKYQDQIVAAQTEAREQKRGLWSACNTGSTNNAAPQLNSGSTNTNTNTVTPQPTPTTPTPAPQEPATTPTQQCNIKGNISAAGEKIYHVPGCGSYNQTKIDESQGEKWFCSEAEAVAAGWRKAKNCP
ncbi:MAG: thermonuclease family protein [Candidatus Buchananbacteria bacterium]|nr:thermonuclease family protein [Candidatus Buchananbacteria bacterium]